VAHDIRTKTFYSGRERSGKRSGPASDTEMGLIEPRAAFLLLTLRSHALEIMRGFVLTHRLIVHIYYDHYAPN
jgi:hypothetical protein